MPVKLNKPKESVALDKVRIAKYEIEDNPHLGTRWIQLYLVLGRYTKEGDPSTFKQYNDPNTGASAMSVKFEIGMHPLVEGTALGKCDACGKWYQKISGKCEEDGCSGSVLPYDGYARLSAAIGAGILKNTCYQFLLSEEIPTADMSDVSKIVDGVLDGVQPVGGGVVEVVR